MEHKIIDLTVDFFKDDLEKKRTVNYSFISNGRIPELNDRLVLTTSEENGIITGIFNPLFIIENVIEQNSFINRLECAKEKDFAKFDKHFKSNATLKFTISCVSNDYKIELNGDI